MEKKFNEKGVRYPYKDKSIGLHDGVHRPDEDMKVSHLGMPKRQFKLSEIIKKTSRRECLLCKTNLDKDIGEGKWHIPLCKKHRMEELDKITKEIIQ